MKTDAMLFSLSNGNEIPKSRMDHLQNSGRRSSAVGFGSAKEPKARFEDTYREVARNNAAAQKETDRNIDSRSERCSRIQDAQEREPESFDRVTSNRVNEISDQKAPETEEEQDDEQASEIIRDSLLEISEELQINIAPGLEDLSFSNVSDDTIKQFAEIVHALKQITGALNMAVSQNQSIQNDSAVIDPQKAGEMVKVLRTELFKIEMGLNKLGIADKVQAQVAAQMDVASDGGILQATNPSDLTMPADQIHKLFGNMVDDSQDSIKALVKKVAELIDQNASDKNQINIQVIPEKKPVTLTTFDSQTYRAMLKLEVKEQVVKQNVEASSGNDKQSVPGLLEPIIAKKVIADSEVEILPLSDVSGKALSGSRNTPLFEVKLPGTYKSIDESVMNQISSKLNDVVRSGATEIKIQLWPESLGEVKLRIRVEGDVVVAKIQVESQQVKQIVENNLQSLKDSLSDHNLQAGAFDVNVGHGWGKQSDEAGNDGWGSQHNVSDDSVGSGQQTADSTVSSQSLGLDTGRRYGSNSVEFFA